MAGAPSHPQSTAATLHPIGEVAARLIVKPDGTHALSERDEQQLIGELEPLRTSPGLRYAFLEIVSLYVYFDQALGERDVADGLRRVALTLVDWLKASGLFAEVAQREVATSGETLRVYGQLLGTEQRATTAPQVGAKTAATPGSVSVADLLKGSAKRG